ncbi:hypothetical protein ABZ682_23045 [Streptomyces griseoviridis]|uniref:hypothetical protein n=1 Tax=Streptomyces griseoviridis TaxID=45398 RepID=UPI0033EE4894
MTDTVEGVAVVLYTPMRDKAAQFGKPSAFPLVDGAEIRFQRRRVGVVAAVWQERGQVLWRGLLDERQWPDITAGGPPLRIPFVDPDVRALVEERHLIGLPAVVQARTATRDGCMLLEDWTVVGMELMTTQVAPWPGMELRLRAKDRKQAGASRLAPGE